METTRTALVLGATGGVGGRISAALLQHGWQVRGLARDLATARTRGLAGIDWVGGDAMVPKDVVAAVRGARVIVHAVNPAGYRNWDRLVLPMIDATLAAARAAGGARILLPGTIYNFDPATTPVIGADSPQRPASRKGAIRVALERRLEAAAPDVPSLVLRAGDFFGPGARASWFAQAMVTPGRPVRRILNPARGAGHSWAYLPDLAEAFARLAEVEETLPRFERLQFRGHPDATGREMIEALGRVIGRPPAVLPFPWWAMQLLSPFGGFPREAAELMPCWRHPVRLDNTRLVKVIGPEPHTPLDEALRASLIDMGCLPPSAAEGRVLASA